MNDFFDKLGAAAKRAAGTVVNEVSVAAEKQKLSDAYRDLGKRYYQALKRGESADLTQEITQIDEILRRIENLMDRRDVTNVGAEPQSAEEAPVAGPAADEPDFVIVEE